MERALKEFRRASTFFKNFGDWETSVLARVSKIKSITLTFTQFNKQSTASIIPWGNLEYESTPKTHVRLCCKGGGLEWSSLTAVYNTSGCQIHITLKGMDLSIDNVVA